ncbi:MAG: S26 family signal peptidase [Clostridium sartagoforme]|nr:S26 family signal peptidase [Clostridium sartagoforme]
MTLGKDEYFIMGDNRLDSTDSRALGPIPETSVISKTIIYSKNTH